MPRRLEGARLIGIFFSLPERALVTSTGNSARWRRPVCPDTKKVVETIGGHVHVHDCELVVDAERPVVSLLLARRTRVLADADSVVLFEAVTADPVSLGDGCSTADVGMTVAVRGVMVLQPAENTSLNLSVVAVRYPSVPVRGMNYVATSPQEAL